MYLKHYKTKAGRIYMSIAHGYRDPVTKKVRHKTVKKIGYVDEFLDQYEDPIAHFKEVAAKMEEERLAKRENRVETFTVPMGQKIKAGTDELKHLGHLPLSAIYHSLGIDAFLVSRQRRFKIEYSLNDVLQLLIYTRLLAPGSKRANAFEMERFPRPFNCEPHDIYRGLDYLKILKEDLLVHVHEAVSEHYGRRTDRVYYDVTNYHFEIDMEDDFRKKGMCKKNSRKPLVQMGLLLDQDAIPITYKLFPGNAHDSQTLMPIIQDTRKRYELGRVVTVADKAMNSGDNVAFLMVKGDGFIFSQKVRGADKVLQDFVLDRKNYRKVEGVVKGEGEEAPLFMVKSRPYPHDFWVTHADDVKRKIPLDVKQIACYNEAYAKRQRHKREEAIQKARRIIESPARYNKSETAGALRYVANVSYDPKTGEVMDTKKLPYLDEEKIEEDAKYDGYYCILTSEDQMPDREVAAAYHDLWEIERSFRITKDTLQTQPVHLTLEQRIDAHFMTCFYALLILRLLSKLTGPGCAPEQLVDSLRRFKTGPVDANLYRTFYYDENLDRISKALGIELDNLHYTKGGLRSLNAASKRFEPKA